MVLEGPDEAAAERYREFSAGMVAVEMPPASDYPLMLQPQGPGFSLNQTIADSFTAQFFQELDATSDCCVEALGKATENLAFLSAALFRKAEETLDEARAAARNDGKNAVVLMNIAHGYLDLAKETA